MMQPDRPSPTPPPLPSHRATAPVVEENVWSDGVQIVLRKGGALPNRCVKCNADATPNPVKRNLSWHDPLIYLIILASPIIYIIVALVIRKTAVVHVPLCTQHRAVRRNLILTAWAVFGLSFVPAVLAVLQDRPILFAVMALLWLTAAVLGTLVNGRTLTPARIDDYYAYLKGACPAYLRDLTPMEIPAPYQRYR